MLNIKTQYEVPESAWTLLESECQMTQYALSNQCMSVRVCACVCAPERMCTCVYACVYPQSLQGLHSFFFLSAPDPYDCAAFISEIEIGGYTSLLGS